MPEGDQDSPAAEPVPFRELNVIDDICAALAAQKDPNKVIISPQALQTTLYQAAYDPYTLFLVDVWNDPSTGSKPGAPSGQPV